MNVSRSYARHALLALTIGCIVALAVLKVHGTSSGLLTDAIGGVLAVAFIALALIDFRTSVAVTIFEIVLGGAGGHWIDYGSLSGRIFLITVVTLRAAWLTILDWRRGVHPVLGRYGAHALAIAFLLPAIWIPLGLLHGNSRHDAIADGNGFLFFAFVLVVLTLLRRGQGPWLRRTFFAACATSGAAYFLLIVATKAGALGLGTVREWLTVRLAMGGIIGHMPNGDYRLFTAGSLFTVIGLALTAQRLLVRPRDVRLWLLGGMFGVDLVATYTRGLWLAALVGVVLVVALEVRSVRQLGLAVGIPVAAGGLVLAVAALAGFSLYSYVSARASTVVATSHTKYNKHLIDPGFEASSGAWGTSGGSSLRVSRSRSVARVGRHSLELSSSTADQDAYVFQDVAVKPNTEYSVSAWVNARALRRPAAGGRGLFVWDVQDGLVYTVPLTKGTHGWRRLSFTFQTRADAQDIQIRLYAPQGHVFWDGVRFTARGPVRAVSATAPVEVLPPTRLSSPKGVLDPGFEASSRAWGTSGGGSLRVSRSRSVARVGRHSLELSSSTAGQNAYVFQDVAVKPNTEYSVSAWVNARALRRPAAGGRGLFVWDAQDGLVYTVPLTDRTHGWRRLSLTFQTRADAQDIQIRLYAPQGRVFWDGVRFTARGPVEVSSTAGTAAAEAMALASNGGSGGDAAGAASNAYRIAEAKALWHYIRRRPIYGYGFGSVATNFSATDYSFELSYLDLLFKAGILGLLLYLSFPLRLVADAFRLRRRRVHVAVPDPRGASPGIVAGVVAGILVAGATNPYLFAAFGLVSILLMVAWLEDPQAGVGSESNRSS